jgi:hypothetical protein
MELSGGVRHGGILYRRSPRYVPYVAGEDGSVWKGDLDAEPARWFRPKPHWRGQHRYVWLDISTKEYVGGQFPRRTAEVILDAFGKPYRSDYCGIGYHDGNQENLRPDNLYWFRRRQPGPKVRRRTPKAPLGETEGYTPTSGDIRRVIWYISKGWEIDRVARRCNLRAETVRKILTTK